jgi:Flp pilus assembly protein TadD
MGRHESALEHLERAAELEADPVVLEHLGDAYQALGRSADAAEAYTRSLDGGHEEPKRVEAKLRAVATASSR